MGLFNSLGDVFSPIRDLGNGAFNEVVKPVAGWFDRRTGDLTGGVNHTLVGFGDGLSSAGQGLGSIAGGVGNFLSNPVMPLVLLGGAVVVVMVLKK